MRRGFSMIELVIVVVIIGIIAAIAVPRVSRAAQTSTFNATQASWIGFEKQMLLYEATYGEFPPAMRSGEFNDCLKDFIRPQDWLAPAPLGGAWTWVNSGGVMGVAISQNPAPSSLWREYDTAFDNGDLNAGLLQLNSLTFMRVLSNNGVQAVGEPLGAEGAAAVELP